MNLGESNNFFRESFRGFNREDVAEYIAKLSKDYTANEEKYKEHIVKLTVELKTKTDEINRLESEFSKSQTELWENDEPDESIKQLEQEYIAEINSLTRELSEKNSAISELQAKLESAKEAASESADLRGGGNKADNETVNQLSLQLAASESEKLYMFNLIKKFISMLEVKSAAGKDINSAASISDIAPKSAIAGEIESGLLTLAGFKKKAAELEAENAGLKESLNQNKTALSDEEQMYKSIMTKLGETVYSANKLAEETVAKAKDEADAVIYRAKTEAAEIIEEADKKNAAINEEEKKKKREITDKYEFIKKEHDRMRKKYKEATGIYELRLDEFEEAINAVYDSLNDGEGLT